LATKTIIDPGHGGTAEVGGSSPNNATGPTGLLEKNVTLDLAKRVLARAQGLDIVLTRSTDVNIGLAARAAFAKTSQAPVFVSIHFNGWDTPDVQGTETYVHTQGSASSLRLATSIQANVVTATGHANRGLKQAGFVVLDPGNHDPATAACLVEISFMTTPNEEARLKTSAYLNSLADAVIAGIKGYLAQPLLEAAANAKALSVLQTLPKVLGGEDAAGTNLGKPT